MSDIQVVTVTVPGPLAAVTVVAPNLISAIVVTTGTRGVDGAQGPPGSGQHTPFGPDTATVSGILTIPTGYVCLTVTGTEDFLGMSPGSMQAGDLCWLTLASARIVRTGASVSSPAMPFSLGRLGTASAQDFQALYAGARLCFQLGPGGTQWNLQGWNQ